MEKELKSSTGVLLRADLTEHGHPTHFGRKGLDKHAPLGPCRILILFPLLAPHNKIGDLFCPVHMSGLLHSVLGR